MSRARSPFHIMIKPISAQCNLRCDYCFYLEKSELYPGRKAAHYRMSDETLEALIRKVIAARAVGQNEVQFAWQGGEPTLMGLPFFERAVALQQRHAPAGVRITNTFQSNGVLIDDAYARFFHAHQFLVGISIDGPQALHDRYRRDTAGRGSFKAVMDGIACLNRHAVDYNLLTVVQNDNAQHPEAVYDFLSGLGTPFIQFIPVVEPDPMHIVSPRTVSAAHWGDFLKRVFHQWRQQDIGRIYVQHFDLMLGLILGQPATLCVHAPECGRALAMEHNGDLYSCDHFVDSRHFLGNLEQHVLSTLIDSPAQLHFGQAKSATLPQTCRDCRFLRLCHGGCPKDRLRATDTGKLNWLCAGYQAFYEETTPYFIAMTKALQRRLPASAYPQFLAAKAP